MLKQVLPPHFGAGAVCNQISEPAVPLGWPGTHCPNFSDWAPGDIVLVHNPIGVQGSLTALAQRGSIKSAIRQAATVTHAGSYLGNGELIDATPGRPVSIVSVWHYCQARALELRRVPGVVGQDIADEARSYAGQPYSLWQVVLSKLILNHAQNPRAMYCSTLVGVAVANATGLTLDADPQHRPLHPAVLASHPALAIVDLEWRKL